MRESEIVCENVRFLLWEARTPLERWAPALAARLQTASDAPLVARLLERGPLTRPEVERVAAAFSLESGELSSTRLALERADPLRANLAHLFARAGRGAKKRFALEYGLDPTTLSRWLGGATRPGRTAERALATFFGLDSPKDLTSEPLFLDHSGGTAEARRRWLRERVDALEPEELAELYPALVRLLGPGR